jgi:hypothetical protein
MSSNAMREWQQRLWAEALRELASDHELSYALYIASHIKYEIEDQLANGDLCDETRVTRLAGIAWRLGQFMLGEEGDIPHVTRVSADLVTETRAAAEIEGSVSSVAAKDRLQ